MADPTNFPAAGDDKSVSLRNSDYARFDLAYAFSLKENFPRIWRRGGNTKGNAQFAILSRVARQGGAPKTRAEEKAIRIREAWAARHFKDHLINGVVAQIKWLVVGEQGEAAMKKIVEEQKKKDESNGRAAATGADRAGEARDLAQRPERRAGDEGESPLYVQQALVRSVRREKRPTPKTPDREVVVVEFVASTEIIDSHDSIVRSNWDLTRYSKNPVLIWMHGRMNDIPAVGNVENLQKVGSTKHEGNAVFDDTTEFDRAVAAKYEKGVLKGFSIGFYPRTIRFERIDDEEVLILDDIEILEISCVNVPSNPEALAKGERDAMAQIEARATKGWERSIARLSANPSAYNALHERVLAAYQAHITRNALPPGGAPLNPTKTHDSGLTPPREDRKAANPGDTTMKDLIISEREMRATKGGVHCEAPCPNCNEKMSVEIKHSALDPDESAKKAAEVATLTTRATSAEKLAETRAAELDAAKARAVEMERTLNETRQYIIADRIRHAEEKLKSLSGEKLFPNEVDAELKLAKRYLSDLDPSKDEKHKGRSVGEIEWEERIATIEKRPSLRLLTPPQTQGNGNGDKTRETDPKVTGAMDQNQASREAVVSAEIESAGKNLLASMLPATPAS